MSAPNRVTTGVVDNSFQLTPIKYEVCLIIDPLFGRYRFHGIKVISGSCIYSLRLKIGIYLQIDSLNLRQLAHDLKHRSKRALHEALQFISLRERGNVPIRWSEVLRCVDNEVVSIAPEEIQSPVCANNP